MSSLTSIEKRYFEDLFAMGSGYVVSKDAYTNATFAEFLRECAKVDIYADKYSFNGDSKAKRLRAFWEIESDPVVGKVLEALSEYVAVMQRNSNKGQSIPHFIDDMYNMGNHTLKNL